MSDSIDLSLNEISGPGQGDSIDLPMNATNTLLKSSNYSFDLSSVKTPFFHRKGYLTNTESLAIVSAGVSPLGSVVIKGAGFKNSVTVTFNSLPAADVVVINQFTITCKLPDGISGDVDVTVALDGDNVTLEGAFEYT